MQVSAATSRSGSLSDLAQAAGLSAPLAAEPAFRVAPAWLKVAAATLFAACAIPALVVSVVVATTLVAPIMLVQVLRRLIPS